jgi:phosphonate transport system substrate-binding protein
MMRANLGCRAAAVLTLTLTLAAANGATAAEPLHFAVGPFQPTATDTKKAYEPFFAYIAKALGTDYDVQVSSDWAGIATALANNQADIAWMGPWGYVLANHAGGCTGDRDGQIRRQADLSRDHRQQAEPRH